eukprot:9496304-Pyramimonas_sp.AAC.1
MSTFLLWGWPARVAKDGPKGEDAMITLESCPSFLCGLTVGPGLLNSHPQRGSRSTRRSES